MSITSLVGLSVDFCIHLSEAFNHAQATWTPENGTFDVASRGNKGWQERLSWFKHLVLTSQPPGREKARYETQYITGSK